MQPISTASITLHQASLANISRSTVLNTSIFINISLSNISHISTARTTSIQMSPSPYSTTFSPRTIVRDADHQSPQFLLFLGKIVPKFVFLCILFFPPWLVIWFCCPYSVYILLLAQDQREARKQEFEEGARNHTTKTMSRTTSPSS